MLTCVPLVPMPEALLSQSKPLPKPPIVLDRVDNHVERILMMPAVFFAASAQGGGRVRAPK